MPRKLLGTDHLKAGGLGAGDDALVIGDDAFKVRAELTGGSEVESIEGAELGRSLPPSRLER